MFDEFYAGLEGGLDLEMGRRFGGGTLIDAV